MTKSSVLVALTLFTLPAIAMSDDSGANVPSTESGQSSGSQGIQSPGTAPSPSPTSRSMGPDPSGQAPGTSGESPGTSDSSGAAGNASGTTGSGGGSAGTGTGMGSG